MKINANIQNFPRETVKHLQPGERIISKKNKFEELVVSVNAQIWHGSNAIFPGQCVVPHVGQIVLPAGCSLNTIQHLYMQRKVDSLSNFYRIQHGTSPTASAWITVHLGVGEKIFFQIQVNKSGSVAVIFFTDSYHIRRLLEEKSKWFILRLKNKGIEVDNFIIREKLEIVDYLGVLLTC
ncbi:MAG: hypothetical protein A2Y62_08680 [Candidatus Fischerbacteria bacterium RBG_13_37_8]|uniref:Uncharacterized protein n=1 Tax=Candidatus Fischerbacteria bacterium RBG_13_37_8 TaxID=1817863 RepID=A0A1F5VQV9_9BACT|nr:MAG: hypothetical protein A2Y62_08680 [Candidatus Fischerbacteria bacterium RBG_13_37_8]